MSVIDSVVGLGSRFLPPDVTRSSAARVPGLAWWRTFLKCENLLGFGTRPREFRVVSTFVYTPFLVCIDFLVHSCVQYPCWNFRVIFPFLAFFFSTLPFPLTFPLHINVYVFVNEAFKGCFQAFNNRSQVAITLLAPALGKKTKRGWEALVVYPNSSTPCNTYVM